MINDKLVRFGCCSTCSTPEIIISKYLISKRVAHFRSFYICSGPMLMRYLMCCLWAENITMRKPLVKCFFHIFFDRWRPFLFFKGKERPPKFFSGHIFKAICAERIVISTHAHSDPYPRQSYIFRPTEETFVVFVHGLTPPKRNA